MTTPRKATATGVFALITLWSGNFDLSDPATKWVLLAALVSFLVCHTVTDVAAGRSRKRTLYEKARVRAAPGEGVGAFFNTWPGDETDEELAAALKEAE